MSFYRWCLCSGVSLTLAEMEILLSPFVDAHSSPKKVLVYMSSQMMKAAPFCFLTPLLSPVSLLFSLMESEKRNLICMDMGHISCRTRYSLLPTSTRSRPLRRPAVGPCVCFCLFGFVCEGLGKEMREKGEWG